MFNLFQMKRHYEMREIRDPIHGFIERTEKEQQIIDTKVFQRLRRIKQLAMAFLAYPGAMHTRFEHSLGVKHIAGRMAKNLLKDEEEIELIRIAALLHDIGHGPFSHVSENILEKFFDPRKIGKKEKFHEQITRDIISKNAELAKIISEREREKIISILSGDLCDPILKGIVSGPLDADKQDYLLRDSYYCGVKYGVFDIERMIDTIKKYTGIDEKFLAVSRDGIYTLEQYIIAKYHMTTQVYRHKVRLVSDAMIVRAIELGIDKDKLDWLIQLYKYDGTDEYICNFLEWDGVIT
ncbi:MAG: HD domain-containing protein [Candidatus Omnitrophota bacterium]